MQPNAQGTGNATTSSISQPATFDFGLDADQEARASRLHRESIVIDLLRQHAGGSIFDHYSPTLQAMFREQISSTAPDLSGMTDAEYWPYEMSMMGHSDLIRDWYRESGLTCGVYDVAVHDGRDPWALKLQALTTRYAVLPWLHYVTTAEEIRQCKRDGRIAFYANWQPTFPVPRNLKCIDDAYERGLRSLMLTYNQMDNIGVGCTERVDAGLSMFGLEVVEHCNAIGMLIDLSHCGSQTTLDACRHSRSPVNANHTCARGVFAHARGKCDDALKAIAGTGGVIGVVAVPGFITDAATPSINHMLDHIDYIAELVGWQHVALGTDWPLQAPADVLQSTLGAVAKQIGFRERDRLNLVQELNGFRDVRDLRNLTRGLVKRGYKDAEIRAILGGNALRVFEDVWR
jgi:membrane dipeptidase